MSDPVPNKPDLTPSMLQADKDAGTSPPGAGGWVPSQASIVLIGAVGVTFGAMAPVFPATIPGPLGVGLGAACGAIAGGCVYFAAKSAGPRSL